MARLCDGSRSIRDSATIKVLHLYAYNGAAWMRQQTEADIHRIAFAHAYDWHARTVDGLAAAIAETWLRFVRTGEMPKIRDGSPSPDLAAIARAARSP